MKYHQKQKVLGYYKTRKEALEALADYNKNPYDLDGLSVTFNECFEAIKHKKFPETRLSQYENAYKYLEPVKNMPIRSIKAGQLQECVDACHDTQQPLIKTLCRRVYEYAMMYEYTDKDASLYIKASAPEAKIEREVFTSEQVNELWTHQSEWWGNVALILLYSGMRTKELKDLTENDIDYANRTIELKIAKNKSSLRKIPIHKLIEPLFRAYFEAGGNLYGYAHSTLNQKLSGFYKHRAHDCRHTFTTRLREVGVDHLTIQRLVGHTPSSITEKVYTHLTMEELTNAIDKLQY